MTGVIRLGAAVGVFTAMSLLAGAPTAAGSDIEVSIAPLGIDEATAALYTGLVMSRPDVKRRTEGRRIRVLRADFGADSWKPHDPGKSTGSVPIAAPTRFRVTFYDYDADRLWIASGDLDRRLPASFSVSEDAIEPTPEEFEEAASLVRQQSEFSSLSEGQRWRAAQAMPALIDPAGVEGAAPRERIIPVTIQPEPGSTIAHEIVGVSLSRPRVIRFRNGAPPTAIARTTACAPPSAGQGTTGRGVPGQANLTVTRGSEVLWTLTVVRPSASAGRWGSGVELKDVSYKGHLVFGRAGTPVLNVLYDQDVCGPYRDWQYSETPFKAEGTLIAPGILQASTRPSTIFESGDDQGNFRGVSVYRDGNDLLLTSLVAAGWYRYKTEWRLGADGTIQPRWGFNAVKDSCTCNAHRHHGYFRLDFDIDGRDGNRVQTFKDGTWSDVATESKFLRRPGGPSAWRVMNSTGTRGYEVTPGDMDGTADDYGKGDIWALRYHDGEMDDSAVYRSTSINLDPFLNGESVQNADVVLWYGVHFHHTFEDERDSTHIVGPTLRPVGWE